MPFFRTPAFLLAIFLGFAQAAPAQQPSGLPDVVGIQPGMSAQDAYNALAARANGSKIGVAQAKLDGISQPVAVLMSLEVVGSSPREEITVWLTFPPQKQVVWAVRRMLTFEKGKELTKAAVMDGLRQKYGPEINANGSTFWSYGEDGQRSNSGEVISNNCVGRANLSAPDNFQTPQPTTPLPYLQPLTNCDKYISVRAELGNANAMPGPLASSVTVTMEDDPAALRSRSAWQALVAGDNANARQQELDKAKQQQKPTF